MSKVRLDELKTSTIGEILVQMKVVTEEQLGQVLELQERLSPEEMLGQLMVARGLIDPGQLEVALNAQKGLRSRSKHLRALAMASLAETSGAKVLTMAGKIDVASQECLRSYGRERDPVMVMTKTSVHGQGNGQRK